MGGVKKEVLPVMSETVGKKQLGKFNLINGCKTRTCSFLLQ